MSRYRVRVYTLHMHADSHPVREVDTVLTYRIEGRACWSTAVEPSAQVISGVKLAAYAVLVYKSTNLVRDHSFNWWASAEYSPILRCYPRLGKPRNFILSDYLSPSVDIANTSEIRSCSLATIAL